MVNKKQKNKKLQKEKKFRLNAKNLFLTYPQFNLSVDLNIIFQILEQKFETQEILNYLLVFENHVDNNRHLHIFLELKKRCNIISSKTLDFKFIKLDKTIVEFHGEYECCRSKMATIQYLCKNFRSKDEIENNPNILISKDILNLLSDNLQLITSKNLYKICLDLAENGKVEDALKLLKEHDSKNYLRSHMRLEKSLRDHYIKSLGFSSKYNLNNFNISSKLKSLVLDRLFDKSDNRKCLYIYGNSGIGKTEFIKCILKTFNKNVLIINNYDSLSQYQYVKHDTIVFDDVSFNKLNSEEIINLVDCNNEKTFHLRYVNVKLADNLIKIIISNKSSNILFNFEGTEDHHIAAIKRRIIEICCDNELSFKLVENNLIEQ